MKLIRNIFLLVLPLGGCKHDPKIVNNNDASSLQSDSRSGSVATFDKKFGGSGNDYGYAGISLNNGTFVICGSEEEQKPANWFLSRLDKNGEIVENLSDNQARGSCQALVKTIDDGGFVAVGHIITSKDGRVDYIRVIRYGADFKPLWAKEIKSRVVPTINQIIQTADHGFLMVGKADSDIIKLNDNGEIEWEKKLFKMGELRSVLELNDGSIVAVGDEVFLPLDFNYVPKVFMQRFKIDGNLIWKNPLGETFLGSIDFIKFGADGNLYFSGRKSNKINDYDIYKDEGLVGKMNLEGNLIWQKTIMKPSDNTSGTSEIFRFVEVDDGFVIVDTERFYLENYIHDDLSIFKYDKDFNGLIWSHYYGADKFGDSASFVDSTVDGGFITVGNSNNSNGNQDDIWVLKLDSEGNL